MIQELDPIVEESSEIREEPEPVAEPVPVPKAEPKAAPKRRGRPPGSKSKPKTESIERPPRAKKVEMVEREPEPEPPRPPQYSRDDLFRATQFFATQLGSLQHQHMQSKRARWQSLFQ